MSLTYPSEADMPQGMRDAYARVRPREGKPVAAKPWSNAKPTEAHGIRFPSKLQARVYERLAEALKPGQTLYCDVRFPLLSVFPGTKRRTPLYITVDFVVVASSIEWLVYDAKPKRRKSREWARGKAAFASFYRREIIEVNA